jgi:hypothetical protein
MSTYLLRLIPEGSRQLQDVQGFILGSNPNQFEFRLNAPFATVPPSAREVTFWADLKLSQSEAFKPLVDCHSHVVERGSSSLSDRYLLRT